MDARGRQLMDGFPALAPEAAALGLPLLVGGLPAMSFVAFTDLPELVDQRDVARPEPTVPQRFGALLAEGGVRAHGRGLWLMSAAHSERDIERTLEASADATREIATERGASGAWARPAVVTGGRRSPTATT